jgi:diaminohydroxyphosphoribosylaminopyrimidine deaminase / 5-amino-6-(5-phosphoribosylamino)uracil reductase
MTVNEKYMQRCLDLAKLGSGNVAPNPMVGCVIVHNDTIIGEGLHKKFGEPHAEVNAINSVPSEKQKLLSSSTLYVNLEPCSHYGKTPPCADLIIAKKIPHVVIGISDPNPLVAGKGIEKLKAAGIRVTIGVLKEQCSELNNRFITFYEKKRPYIILKWAQTNDGFIAPVDGKRLQISGKLSQQLVHKWRGEEPSILVGYNTALNDDPQLNVREWKGNNPARIVIDSKLELPKTLHLFDNTIPTVVFNEIADEKNENIELIKIDFGDETVKSILSSLYNRKIQSVLVEGGAKTLLLFIKSGLWDEARVFISPNNLQAGIKAPHITNKEASTDKIGEDKLIIYKNSNS